MSTIALPPNHRRETLTPYSPAVYGRICAVTGEPLRAGNEVVVCDAVPGSDPMLIEGWTTQGSCPHCGVATGSIAYVPPVWGPPPAPSVAPPAPPPERSRALVGGVAGLLLLALAAMAVAIFVFVIRTRQPTEPPAATLSIAALTATAATAATTTPPANATTATTATVATTATATPVGVLPLPTLLPSKTPPPPAVPTPTPTLMPTPTPPPDSPITSLILVNPGNERVIRALRANDTIDLSQIGRNTLAVRAEVDSSAVESVIFLLDGDAFCVRDNCVENAAPYYMGGDQNGDVYEDWDWSRMLGSHTLTAIACTGDSGSGSCFPPVEVRLTVSR